MPKDFSKYYRAEEAKAKAVSEGNQDQYNMQQPLDVSKYRELIHTTNHLKYSVQDGQKLNQWLAKLELYINLGVEKSERIHISPPKGAWYQHRNPAGCFCCEDQDMISYMYHVLQIIAHKYPNFIIK